jgi:hypothetical protein
VQLLLVGLLILPIALLTLVVALVIARREPDPTGRGIYGVYVFLVTFLALFIASFAFAGVVTQIVKLIQGAPTAPPLAGLDGMTGGGLGGSLTGFVPTFDATAEYWRSLLQALTVGLAAAGVLRFHARRAAELLGEPATRTDATARAYRYYLHATLLVAVLTLLFASASAMYGIIRAIGPGLTATASDATERRDGVQQLVGGGFLALTMWAIFIFHWRKRQEDDRPAGRAGVALVPPVTTPSTPPSV